ncbi:cation-translocating P-type ATPase [Flavonifractor sp. DFI.6.63]|uniref:P-type Ca(2+) transporter n=1 Tax=Lawsonibacter hominis TaxID=2763053 RepID=A0A8J6JCQ2_9FIRM|nr:MULTISPECIES: cation-translocating P-type ATPase [Oscillospiraceae]MBC5732804.1 cation-translocating P-type ATPase [Lawsonibacter hominis]MCI6397909.1 cation-translocating P-type ATPase [Lawsonibacter sp.]MCQ5028359.1 cation-translocating P-type ATPase [Flavonifractor sp. DFI.6.63]MDY2977538.1 cation-translocating P-type ATPase [Oscillospiraceae bacterium]
MAEAYYRKTPQQALEAQKAAPAGLSGEEVRRRTGQYGPNKLSEGKQKSVSQIFFEQFKDLLVVILLIAAVISALSENVESTIVIFAVLVLNAILGTAQYVKAEKSLESLKAMSAPSAKVLRGGVRLEIPSADVVPGDIVLLEAGDMVVADGRILENFSLKVNESSLTGESEGVDKTAEAITAEQVALGDQKNMVFSGSLVTYGRATVLVTATGMETELGKIAALMNQTQQRKTPLQESLDKFSAKLATVIMIICAAVFLLSIFRTGMGVLDSLMFAVALAVAAIPEALSSIVTIVLAMGTQKMARQNAIIKDLKAVESLGSVSVICSDKTGTLTQNKMTPQKVYADGSLLEGDDLNLVNDVQRLLLKAALLASDATNNQQTGASIGDPTEVALVQLGEKFGVDEEAYRAQHPRLGELAFDSDRKLMSTLHDIDGVPTLFTKGAIDVLLQRSNYLLTREGPVEMTPERREAISRINMELSMEGLRVLSFGYKELPGFRPPALSDEDGFTFIGLISMIDPPRPEAIQAVSDAREGGIRTIMITGDHKVTASAIAKQLGIFREGDEAVSGVELDNMTDADLDQRLAGISVYARVSPEHKIRIVNAWQRRGSIVSMTGDGVNDAPALKKADIGVAMGITGTEVSKDAASMILADDNFATIVKAVVNGRSVYANIKNAIQFLLSGNAAGIFCVLYASLLALPVPFQPVHLLFINLLTDSLPAIAIGMEPARKGLLRQKPRDPKEPILNKSLLSRIGAQGLLIAVVTMIAFYLGYQESAALASTMAFATLTLARLFHGFNCRGDESVFRLKLSTNLYSILAFCAGVVLLLAVLFIPGLKSLFLVAASFRPANLGEIVLLAFLPTLVIQLVKVLCDLRRGK